MQIGVLNLPSGMLRTLNYNILRRLTYYLRSSKDSLNLLASSYPKVYISRASKLLVGSQICCSSFRSDQSSKIDVDDQLRKACEEGDAAVIRLMDQLKEFVITVSHEYRMCLNKQIEITETASNIGPFSEVWDELPRYRTLADELSRELNDYMAILNTIGQMAKEESLVHLVTGSNGNISSVNVKFKELESLLQREFEHNRKIELKLLEIKRDSILKDVMG